MPVDRCVLVECIGDLEGHLFAFAEPDQWSGQRSVDRDGMAGAATDLDGAVADGEVKGIAGDFKDSFVAGSSAPRPGREQGAGCREETTGGGRAEEIASCEHGFEPCVRTACRARRKRPARQATGSVLAMVHLSSGLFVCRRSIG